MNKRIEEAIAALLDGTIKPRQENLIGRWLYAGTGGLIYPCAEDDILEYINNYAPEGCERPYRYCGIGDSLWTDAEREIAERIAQYACAAHLRTDKALGLN